MYDSKLLRILGKLSAKEMRTFKEFVHSPLHNKHKNLRVMVDIIADTHPSFTARSLDRKAIFKKVFPGEKYTEHKVTDLMSYMVRLLYDFLAWNSYDQQEYVKDQNLLRALRKKGLDKTFLSVKKRAQDSLEDQQNRDEDYYYYHYLLENEADIFFIRHEVRKQDESLQRKVDNLDLFYLSAKLKSCCEMLNRKNIVAAEYDFQLLDELLSYVDQKKERLASVPSILMYYEIIKTLTEDEADKHFYNLKKLLKAHGGKFDDGEAAAMYGYAQNYCVKKVNSGDLNFLEELFSLYKLQLEEEIIDGKYLSQWQYKNIVAAGMRLDEGKWVRNFIEVYKGKLGPEYQENAYAYNLAYYFYSSEQYGDALELLQSVEFTDVYYHLGSKSMLLKMYYDLNEEESLFSLIESFKTYLRRNKKISEYQRTIHLNLIKFTNKIFRLKLRQRVNKRWVKLTDLEKIKKDVSTKKVNNLDWLQSKLKELEDSLPYSSKSIEG